jgi:predicted nucleic acid-binding protein
MMIFADLVNGDSVFLDANALIYHFGPHPQLGPACHQLMQRIENQDLLGFTSTHILTEVAHRLMTLEAAILAGWSFREGSGCVPNPPYEFRSNHR